MLALTRSTARGWILPWLYGAERTNTWSREWKEREFFSWMTGARLCLR